MRKFMKKPNLITGGAVTATTVVLVGATVFSGLSGSGEGRLTREERANEGTHAYTCAAQNRDTGASAEPNNWVWTFTFSENSVLIEGEDEEFGEFTRIGPNVYEKGTSDGRLIKFVFLQDGFNGVQPSRDWDMLCRLR